MSQQIILDFGSGNTSTNDINIVKEMIDELVKVDTHKHEVIIKWQLFKKAGNNIPLETYIFDFAYEYANTKGYQTTASVFDLDSLKYLLRYDTPFIKIANNRNLDYLIGNVPRKIPVYVSVDNCYTYTDITCDEWKYRDNIIPLACISNYPATMLEYSYKFDDNHLRHAISDHTSDWFLFEHYQPKILEVHYKLDSSTGLDAGSFSRTPTQLAEVL